MPSTPKLVHVVNVNTFRNGPPPHYEQIPLEKRFKLIAAAGFTAISASLTPDHQRLADKYGIEHRLGFIGGAAGTPQPDDFAELLKKQKECGAIHINVQIGDHDTPPAVAAKQWIRLLREAEKIGGLEVSIETHRDTSTETPEKAYEIADRVHRATGQLIRFTFDFSHFAVVKSLEPDDYVARLLDRPELVTLAEMFHFRPFNGQHAQVQVHHRGRITPEGESFLAFAENVMRLWRSDLKNQGRTFFSLPEILPFRPGGGGYNVTGFGPPWPSVVAVRDELAKIWVKSAFKKSPIRKAS